MKKLFLKVFITCINRESKRNLLPKLAALAYLLSYLLHWYGNGGHVIEVS